MASMGGKSRAADVVWRGLGPDVVNFVEPFAGSIAVLLGRPGGAGKIETVNDLSGAICNFWRAVKSNPDAVAEWCDDPVSELDLHARHAWLVVRLDEMAEQLRADPEYFDAKVAGWWVWGICQWIGTGWCGGIRHGEPRPNLNTGQGVHALGTRELPNQRPHVSGDSAGMGVLSKKLPGLPQQMPHLLVNSHGASGSKGVHAEALSQKLPNLSGYDVGVRSPKQQIPELPVPARARRTGKGVLSQKLPALRVDSGASGNGIHAGALPQKMPFLALPGKDTVVESGKGVLSRSASASYSGLPAIGNDRGINGVSAPPCLAWFRALQERLRRVRVVCGDWTRVLGPSVLGKGKNVGGRRPCAVFLDPPYDVTLRAKSIYGHDRAGLAAEVRAWAVEHGDDPDLRICLAGYFSEHAEHMPASWTVHRWKGARGYAGDDNDNREQETLWFSPHCLPLEQQRGLFDSRETA